MSVKIKRSHLDEGGFFDPHTHFSGITPYRVLSMHTAEGVQLLSQWRRSSGVSPASLALASPPVPAVKLLTDLQLEDFLAHHTLHAVLKPPYQQTIPQEQLELAKGLYDLETRLLVLQNFSLGWGLVAAPPNDVKRIRENAGTLEEIIKDGCSNVAYALREISKKLSAYAFTLPAERPDKAAIDDIIDGILQMDFPLETEKDYETGLPKVVRHANQNALTATPQNDFDSAYVARGLLKIPIHVQLAAGMRELKRQNITYSEQSVPAWTLDKWKSDQAGDLATAAVKEHETTGTVVRWLPMIVGTFLGWAGDNDPQKMLRLRTTPPKAGENRPALPESARTAILPYNDWAAAWAEAVPFTGGPPPTSAPASTVPNDMELWATRLCAAIRQTVPYAVGFDIASPERTWYTPAGTGLLEGLLWKIFETARDNGRRVVAHIHVGEGYPAFTEPDLAKVQGGEKRTDQRPLPILYDEEKRLPAHFLCAENNVEQTLRAVIKVRERAAAANLLGAFDEHVRVRFGHVTHASLLQAQQMAENNIWADVNLTSNLATGALTFTASSTGMVTTPFNPGLIKWAADMVRDDPTDLFKHHALVTLLSCRVPTVVGTDGGGIEHSFMEREYALANAILERAAQRVDERAFTLLGSTKSPSPVELTNETAAALKRRLDVTRLYEYQNAHHSWITSGPAVQASAISPFVNSLDHGLHNVFLNAVGGR